MGPHLVLQVCHQGVTRGPQLRACTWAPGVGEAGCVATPSGCACVPRPLECNWLSGFRACVRVRCGQSTGVMAAESFASRLRGSRRILSGFVAGAVVGAAGAGLTALHFFRSRGAGVTAAREPGGKFAVPPSLPGPAQRLLRRVGAPFSTHSFRHPAPSLPPSPPPLLGLRADLPRPSGVHRGQSEPGASLVHCMPSTALVQNWRSVSV
jgi:hypothetical protein